jgi:hypothetical protein
MAVFGSFEFGEAMFAGMSPPVDLSERVAWVFQELGTAPDTYILPINPLDATMPSLVKTVTTLTTASGLPVNFEGAAEPGQMKFSGTLLMEEQFRALEEWSKKTTQIQITDDLLQSYWVVITMFDPRRAYHPQYPWRHEYTIEATVISWP